MGKWDVDKYTLGSKFLSAVRAAVTPAAVCFELGVVLWSSKLISFDLPSLPRGQVSDVLYSCLLLFTY